MKTNSTKRQARAASMAFLLCTLPFFTGCLVIGGKTHICANDKEYKEHIAKLESRIQTLEQYAGITPPAERKNEISVASLEIEKVR